MLPLRLELKNFLPYRSPDPIRFDGIHLASLTGPNGAGKSSLLDAITWVLWGKARAKRDEELIHLGQSDMYVQLDFEQEGVVYRVLRRRSHGKRGQGTLDLFIIDGDRPRLESEPSMRQTQDRINRILRLDYETFVHSAFLQQGKADAFTTKNPAERKRILSDILGLEKWAQYEEQAKEYLKVISNELQLIELETRRIDSELAREPQLRKDLEDAESAHAEAQDTLRLAEASLAEVAHAPGALRSAQDQLAAQERRQRERQRDLDSVVVEIARHEKRMADYQQIIDMREEIEAGYAALQSAREVDSALGEKLQQLSDFDTQHRDLERQLDAARAELESERSGYLARISELERHLDQMQADDLSAVQAQIMELQALQASRDDIQEQANALEQERAGLDAENAGLRDEMFSLKAQLERVQSVTEPRCPLCGQELDEAHRQQIIEQLTGDGKQRGDKFRANQSRVETVVVEIQQYKSAVKDHDRELRRLQPLLERAGVLQEQMNTANEAAVRLDQERAGLEAVAALLESETFAQEIREQLKLLETERDALGYDRDSHDAARQQLATFRSYEAQQVQLQSALDSLPEAQQMLDNALARRDRIQKALEEDVAEIEQQRAEIEQLEVLVREQQIRQQEVNKQRTAERMVYQRVVNVRQELSALAQQRERKAELQERQGQKRHEEGVFNELKKAFGKNGIPAMIIETAIPELETTANDLLARMTDGQMHLRMTTQREKVTGGVAETLDIEIADELGTRSYELYSGGEAFRIDFAIRVALSHLLARRAGAHLRTLFIDEGFGTQDDDGRNKLVEAITAIQDSFDLILVITHIEDLRDSFPVHVVVDKTPNGSRLAVR